MRVYRVEVKGYAPWEVKAVYEVEANSLGTACRRAVQEFQKNELKGKKLHKPYGDFITCLLQVRVLSRLL